MRSQKNSKQPASGPRAFTLLEMLTVIAILAILIAIIIPAINGARNAARKTDTRVQMVGVTQGIAAFQQDNKRLPGYFSPRQMGAATNGVFAGGGRGFTQMENMMIDLLGGISTQAPNGTSIITVGPGTATQDQVVIDTAAMGASTQSKAGATTKSYLAFDAKRFVQQGVVNGVVTNPNARSSTANDHYFIPTLIDSFGQPILAWTAEETPSAGVFAETDVGAAGANGARFYWAQNSGFLNAQELGKLKQDQRSDKTVSKRGSALAGAAAPSGTAVSTTDVKKTLAALLGNAAQPNPTTPTEPLVQRAPVVLHSAGLDGLYVGITDKGARSGSVSYAPNQDPFGGTLFDDIIVTGGN